MQRTFDLAYFRTALGELSFAVLVLKVFQPRFQVIGLLYTLLCLGHVGVAAWRRKVSGEVEENEKKQCSMRARGTDAHHQP
ncbi:hypothetical protein BCV69DRAFT_254163 [Microstroma glucosiphilum]|uniref:Uncharacterized protein n=1 Tax=Pseudomicrostroma glucosiphilum TaxID=1684307 RepID=A0A316UK33_9BASI|nr:hypothetical protein BCV69DRAFT_254163 [Pseudomicrostroma glucosiphilum]PWN23585.1 hypothetical protein BCV69DRAFT_254163 [Pseudomicrostroma glucosiphilum]